MIDYTELKQYVINALKTVYNDDYHLIRYPANERRKEWNHVGERAIVFRFAHYLQNTITNDRRFEKLNLDCEYNRNGKQPKRLPSFSNGTFPDVILHRRGTNDSNILVIEFKGYWNKNQNNDIEKLCEFTKQRAVYNFQLGMAIMLGEVLSDTLIFEIQDGEIISKTVLAEL